VDPDANLIFGAVIDPALESDVSITLIATGVGPKGAAAPAAPASRAAPVAADVGAAPAAPAPAPAAAAPPSPGPGAGRAAGGAIGGPLGAGRVRMDVPTGGVEIPAFLRKLRR
jgi:hypothetical protein